MSVEPEKKADKVEKKVLVGLGGSIEGLITSALLKTQGYDVSVLHIKLAKPVSKDAQKKEFQSRCTKYSDPEAIKSLCERMGVAYLSVDAVGEFEEKVIDPFVHDLIQGRKPTPCANCNGEIILKKLIEKADEMKIRWIATGHYARIANDFLNGEIYIQKAILEEKDQSYFLYGLSKEVLSRLMTPLGSLTLTMLTKLAGEFMKDPEFSLVPKDFCFLDSQKYKKFVAARVSPSFRPPGSYMTSEGGSLGENAGIFAHYIGQKDGMSIELPRDKKVEPYSVTGFDIKSNIVYVGYKRDLFVSDFFAIRVHWINPVDGVRGVACKVKVGPLAPLADCRITNFDNQTCHIELKEPQMLVIPGQRAVFYRNDCVLGGGVIENVRRYQPPIAVEDEEHDDKPSKNNREDGDAESIDESIPLEDNPSAGV